MKDCTFQYATDDGIILENTGLITKEEAESLWNKYVPVFKKHMEAGKEPEMVIWINMENDGAFHTTSKHWCASDFVVRDGKMFSVVPIA